MRQRITHALTYLGTYGTCTAFDVGVMATTRLALGWPPFVAVTLGFMTNVTAGFVLGRMIVFPGSRTRLGTASWRYAVLAGFNVLIAVGGVTAAVVQGVNYLLARLVASVGLVVVNYVVMRWWVFDVAKPGRTARPATG
jgi:putative flippase GtrA